MSYSHDTEAGLQKKDAGESYTHRRRGCLSPPHGEDRQGYTLRFHQGVSFSFVRMAITVTMIRIIPRAAISGAIHQLTPEPPPVL